MLGFSCQHQTDQEAAIAYEPSDLLQKSTVFLEKILTDSTEESFIQDKYYVLSDVDNLLPPPHLEEYPSEADLILDVLHEEDENFIRKQLRERQVFSTEMLKRKNFTIVPLQQLLQEESQIDSLWSFVNDHYENGFYSVSKPIFSKDLKKAYVRIGHLCGLLCGGGETRIYQYVDDTWELAEVVEVWVN